MTPTVQGCLPAAAQGCICWLIPRGSRSACSRRSKNHRQKRKDADSSDTWLQLLKAFFLDLRARQGAVEGNLVTLRQLESLIRLCEARARMDMRELVTEASL